MTTTPRTLAAGVTALVVMMPSLARALDVPPGFVLQILEPTGGKIARPQQWFYAERHQGRR